MDTEAPAMKRLLLVLLIAGLLVAPVLAAHANFQGWTNESFSSSSTQITLVNNNDSIGELLYYRLSNSIGPYMTNINPAISDYIAFDNRYPITANLYSSTGSSMSGKDINCGSLLSAGRVEIKDIDGIPNYYCDGAYYGNSSFYAYNPAYIRVYTTGTGTSRIYFDNPTIGETDHHVVGTIPTNWTLIKDLISPASVGVYAISPAGAQVFKNSNYFAVDADTDSLDTVTSEQLIISNAEGGVVNSTTIDSTVPHHLVIYRLSQFFTEANNHYGLFSIHFANSSVYTYFSVIGNGASVSLDTSQYTVGDTMIATYSVTPSYWDTVTYDYTMKFISATDGSTLATNVIGSSSGTSTYTLKSTDTTGVVYAALIATPKTPAGSAGIWMNYAFATFMQYSAFIGYVNDAQAGTPISGAALTMNQSGILYSITTNAVGNYSTSGTSFVTGIPLQITTTATGYFPYNATITPVSETTIFLNISMNSTTPTYTGLGIGGIVRDGIFGGQIITNGYGRPIPAATAYIKNTTFGQYCTNVSNVAGWYKFDETNGCMLTSGRLYNVWSSKAGFSNSPNYTAVAA